MKKVLLLGATGFVGRNIADALQTKEYALIPINSAKCNLLDSIAVKELVKDVQPDFVINAAFRGVDSNAKFSKSYLYENLEMIINIIEACKNVKSIKKMLFIGSSLEYGDSENPISETEQLKPKNMYATIKAMNSLLTVNLAKEYEVPLILIRAFNLYGKYDTKGIVYHVIHSILNKKSLSLSEGKQVRDYLSIDDFSKTVVAILQNYEKFPNFEIYNVGSGKAVKMRDLFNTIFKLMDYKEVVLSIPYRKNDYFHHVADLKKLHAVLPFHSTLSLEEGINNTIEWVKSNQKS